MEEFLLMKRCLEKRGDDMTVEERLTKLEESTKLIWDEIIEIIKRLRKLEKRR